VLGVVWWVLVLAIVFMLVRPGSKAGTAVVALADALGSVIATVTGAPAAAGTGGSNGG
jgi:hypothetical protein